MKTEVSILHSASTASQSHLFDHADRWTFTTSSIQVDGKIGDCGESGNNGTKTFGLVRYLTNGTLDTAFSDDGITTVDFPGGPSTCSAVRIQTENKIVATGNVGFGDFSASGFGIFVRLNIDGSVDSTFGADGTGTVVEVEIRPDDKIRTRTDLLILPDGRIPRSRLHPK
ncbi:MAG: hypothetical protein IPK58_00415 [Acidobacteria bacterium]|nr:hypothetical protein [Acidobacteriota bacterium]